MIRADLVELSCNEKSGYLIVRWRYSFHGG